MYRRGPYYRRLRQFARLRQNATLVALAALFIGAGLNILPRMASAWNAHYHDNSRQSNVGHRVTSSTNTDNNTKTSVSSPTALSPGSAGLQAPASIITPIVGSVIDLLNPSKKELAMRLVSSAENSSTDWRAQYSYIEDIGDGRGFTAGIVGFCSGTGDLLELVQYYAQIKPANALAAYVPALKQVNGTDSHSGLGASFVVAWKAAASDPLFQQVQDHERDRVYFDPAIAQAKSDGLRTLGQFMYYDAMVMHGPGGDATSFGGLRASVIRRVKPPSQGGNEGAYLNAFLDARKALMITETAHNDTSRVDTEQRIFLANGNLDLTVPLSWKTYGDPYMITTSP